MTRPPELEGGSWARGRKEFFGEQAGCAKCHAIHGQGGDLGPFERLRHILARPFDDQPDAADLAAPPGAEQWNYRAFCGT